MGAYGPIEPGSIKEILAIQGLKNMQVEDIARTQVIVMSARAEGDDIQKAFKDYASKASPFMSHMAKTRDKDMKALLESEVSRGSFTVTAKDSIAKNNSTVRLKPRDGRKMRLRGKE